MEILFQQKNTEIQKKDLELKERIEKESEWKKDMENLLEQKETELQTKDMILKEYTEKESEWMKL